MKISIRNFLLLNLLLAVTITTTLTVIGNYYLDQKDIEEHLDAILIQNSLAIQALIGDNNEKHDIEMIQHHLRDIPKLAQHLYNLSKDGPEYNAKYEDSFQFQVWNDKGDLLIRSAKAPNISFSAQPLGFHDKYIHEHQWRIFSFKNPETEWVFSVAERYDLRNELAHQIAVDDLYIMLWTYPLSGLLIWFIIGRGLDSLRSVANEVSHRDPANLEAVNADAVPMEIKPLVEELNKLFLRLHQALDREKRFAADAAHELRTPLAALRMQAQVALNAVSEEERSSLLQNLIACVDRSTHVVQQLLTLSRLTPEANTIDDILPMNLTRLAAEVIAQLAPTAFDKQIDISLETEDEVYVSANVTALSILIRNLIDNAIRYTPSKGEVRVAILDKIDRVIFRVSDNGPGIPPQLRARVFERFFRVLGNKSPGSGLGLAIVQQIAKLHRASVKLGTAQSGHGLEVEVSFPKEKKHS